MTTVYIAIGACFALNLIIIIAFRAADRKDRSLKNVNQQIKNFRGEVQSTIGRLMTQAHDCEQNISARVDSANEVINQVAESMDMLMVHQKELASLEEVCRNYKLALEKLRTMTEQAEARILAVQAEVRSAEAVKDFVDQFRKESERLTSQMQGLKADYVRLVASTEQDLKATATNQKEENSIMLSQFSAAIERARVQLSDYVASEKLAYDELCRQQEEEAKRQLDVLDAKCRETEVLFQENREKLDEFMGTINAGLDDLIVKRDTLFNEINVQVENIRQESDRAVSTLETRRDTIFNDMDNKVSEVKGSADAAFMEMTGRRDNIYKDIEEKFRVTTDDMDNAIRSTEDTLEAKLADKEEEIAASLVNFTERLQEREDEVQKRIDDLSQRKDNTIDFINTTMDEAKAENERLLAGMKDERDETLRAIDERMQQMKASISSDIADMDNARLDAVALFSTRMEERKTEVSEALSVLQGKKDNLEVEFNEYIRTKDEEFHTKETKLEESRTQFTQRCNNALEEVLDSTMNEGNAYLERLRLAGEDFLKVVGKGISDSEEAYRLVNEAAYGKLREVEDILRDYDQKKRESEGELSEQGEKVRLLKEKIWNLKKEEEELKAEVEQLSTDKNKVQSETAEAREKRISEEANLVRLKGQQKAMNERKAQEEAAPKVRMAVEEMNLDDFDTEEFVDISDDED